MKLDGNNQPYEFGKKLDEHIIGREKDFYVHFVTPLNANAIAVGNISMYSAGHANDLIVSLPEDKRLFDELRMIKKTELYVQMTNSPSLDPTKQRILAERAQQNADRKRTVINHLKESIGDAKLYQNGAELTDIGTREPKTKITLGVQQMIKSLYTSLAMLKVDYTEAHLLKIMQSQDDVLFKDTLHDVEVEVINRIQLNNSNHERTTIKSLIDAFNGRPYGWYQMAVLCIIAKLYKRNKISLKQTSNNLDDRAALDALQKNNQYANTIVELEEEIPNTQIQKLKNFYQEYFNEPNLGKEPKEISKLMKQRLAKEVSDISEAYTHRRRFKFLEALEQPLNRLKALAEKEHPYFFNALPKFEDEMLDDKERVLDHVKKFMSGAQKEILETVLHYLESNNANFDYIGKESIDTIRMCAESDRPYYGSVMQDAKAALEEIKKEIASKQEEERAKAKEVIQQRLDKLASFEDYAKLDPRQKDEVNAPLEKCLMEVKVEKFIGNIRTKADLAVSEIYPKQLERMTRLANPPKPEAKGESIPPKPNVYVRKENVKVHFAKPSLETKQDVEDYITALREQYLRIINEDKRISL